MKSYGNHVRILIVDDHPLVREGLAHRLTAQEDLEVVGEAATEEEAKRKVKELEPDLVIVDISLKEGHGLELIKYVRLNYPKLKMLALSSFQESLYAERALRAGALGYLNKQESNEKVIDAIRTVLAGNRFTSPEMAQKLMEHALNRDKEPEKEPIERLSDRELEIFGLIGRGLSSSVIADKLLISTHTIDTHRENIKRKLNIKSAGELVRVAVQWVLENA